jgi:hypothetical protein
MRRIICLSILALAVAAPAAGARPAPLDSPPVSPSVQVSEPAALAQPAPASTAPADDDAGLAAGWIVVLASGGALAVAGIGFAGGRRQAQHHLPARG